MKKTADGKFVIVPVDSKDNEIDLGDAKVTGWVLKPNHDRRTTERRRARRRKPDPPIEVIDASDANLLIEGPINGHDDGSDA